jgi:hypothetical protein
MKIESEITRGEHVASPNSMIPFWVDNRFRPSDLNEKRRARSSGTPLVSDLIGTLRSKSDGKRWLRLRLARTVIAGDQIRVAMDRHRGFLAYRGLRGLAKLPADSWRRGGLGGEVVEDGVVDGGRNSSSELLLRTVRSGRGSTHHSGAQTNTRSCQGGVQGWE